jgi:3-deoxy-7-phosphoheptulonate synthase
MRTANLDGGHVAYMRGIANPIAVKIGPAMTEDWLIDLLKTLNPHKIPGRLTLIMRLGVDEVANLLPKFIEIVKRQKQIVLWSCDPMHGNTKKTKEGIKTRRFDDILGELQESFRIHQTLGTYLGGVHFELTGEDVTECIGGARGLTEHDLTRAYESLLDPRLNYEQSLEMSMLITRFKC